MTVTRSLLDCEMSASTARDCPTSVATRLSRSGGQAAGLQLWRSAAKKGYGHRHTAGTRRNTAVHVDLSHLELGTRSGIATTGPS
jgi:hypothetical protein